MKFDPYEYISVIVPGAVVLVAASILYPSVLPVITSNLTLGDLGLMLILAFVTGHLVQAGGNLWEALIWSFSGGMPTTWVSKNEGSLLTADQLQRLDVKLKQDFQSDRASLKTGRGPTRELFVHIRKFGKTDRIDKFNRNYGLMRGVSVALLAAAIMVLAKDPMMWKEAAQIAGLAAVASYRMIRFGVHYAREMFAEYLAIDTLKVAPTSNSTQSAKT